MEVFFFMVHDLSHLKFFKYYEINQKENDKTTWETYLQLSNKFMCRTSFIIHYI